MDHTDVDPSVFEDDAWSFESIPSVVITTTGGRVAHTEFANFKVATDKFITSCNNREVWIKNEFLSDMPAKIFKIGSESRTYAGYTRVSITTLMDESPSCAAKALLYTTFGPYACEYSNSTLLSGVGESFPSANTVQESDPFVNHIGQAYGSDCGYIRRSVDVDMRSIINFEVASTWDYTLYLTLSCTRYAVFTVVANVERLGHRTFAQHFGSYHEFKVGRKFEVLSVQPMTSRWTSVWSDMMSMGKWKRLAIMQDLIQRNRLDHFTVEMFYSGDIAVYYACYWTNLETMLDYVVGNSILEIDECRKVVLALTGKYSGQRVYFKHDQSTVRYVTEQLGLKSQTDYNSITGYWYP